MTAIVAILYSFCSIVGAAVAARLLLPGPAPVAYVNRAVIFWLAVLPMIYLLPEVVMILMLCAFLFVMFCPRELDEIGPFYIVSIFAVPSGLSGMIGLPGINQIIILDFVKATSLVLLIPVLLMHRTPRAARVFPAAGLCIIAFIALLSIQDFRGQNLTSGLRSAMSHVLFLLVPFLGMLRLFAMPSSFDKLFQAFVMLAILFAAISLANAAVSWNFYLYAEQRFGGLIIADFRYGILRVSATTIPILVGFVMLLGLVATEYFRRVGRCGFLTACVLRATFLGTAYLTYSRGGWLAMALAVTVFYFFTCIPQQMRRWAGWATIIVGPAVGYIYFASVDLNDLDSFGTFDYRERLFAAAMVQISEYPFFGDADYFKSGNFDHLYTGLGIIDFVNVYLQVALEYGLVGLTLFVLSFGLVLGRLLCLPSRRWRSVSGSAREGQRAALVAILLGYLCMIGTISDVSLIAPIGMICLGLGAAFVGVVSGEKARHLAQERVVGSAMTV